MLLIIVLFSCTIPLCFYACANIVYTPRRSHIVSPQTEVQMQQSSQPIVITHTHNNPSFNIKNMAVIVHTSSVTPLSFGRTDDDELVIVVHPETVDNT